MNILVKVSGTGEEFTLYGMDFVPGLEDRIIRNNITYRVLRRIWNDNTSELSIVVGFDSYVVDDSDDNDVLDLISKGQILEAVKLYRDLHSTGLREAKDWVDAHR